MAALRAGDDKTAQGTAKKNMSTALSVFSTVLSAGVGAATGGTGLAVAGPLLYSTGSTIAQPLIVDDLTKDWKVPDTVDADDIQNILRAQSSRRGAVGRARRRRAPGPPGRSRLAGPVRGPDVPPAASADRHHRRRAVDRKSVV